MALSDTSPNHLQITLIRNRLSMETEASSLSLSLRNQPGKLSYRTADVPDQLLDDLKDMRYDLISTQLSSSHLSDLLDNRHDRLAW